jgi:hypothetical protein
VELSSWNEVLNPRWRPRTTSNRPSQVGIQFLEVAKETSTRKHLNNLDEKLIVDIMLFTGTDDAQLHAAGIVKGVLMSVNRRLDCTSKEMICY